MKRPLQFLLLVVLLATAGLSATESTDNNLIEYSYGGFADGSPLLGPMLNPPIVKIYQDGRIVFYRNDKFWEGIVPPQKLRRFKKYLGRNRLLGETRLIEVKRGSSPGFHGGMTYIRYLSGSEEVIIGAMLLPSRGPWNRLVERIRAAIPSTYHSFVPGSVHVYVHKGGRLVEPVSWPFSEEYPLAHRTHPDDRTRFDDRRVSAFLMRNLSSGFSWLNCVVREGGEVYSLTISEVPEWYQPSGIELLLGFLVADAEAN